MSQVQGAPARRRSGRVVPHRLSWPRRLLAFLVYALTEAMSFTLRFRMTCAPELLESRDGPFIFCVWHNRLPLSLLGYRRYARHRGQPPRLAAMVSASRDGAVVARILELFGAQPVRGSTSRRGPQALVELKSWAERGYDLALTPDGPRGPRYVVQMGAVALAQVTGRPVVPASYWLGWKIRMNTWDGFQIPLPFSRVEARLGPPLRVPRHCTEAEREALRQELERRLRGLTED